MYSANREIWRKYTDEETFSRIREMDTVADMWRRCLDEYAAQTAIVDNGSAYSYAQLEEDCARFRALLGAAETKGRRIGLLIPNSYVFAVAYLAVVTLGGTAVVLPAHLDEKAVFGCCMKFGISALVAAPELAARTAFAAERIPSLRLLSSADRAESGVPMAEVGGADPCVIMFTGGTTGKSKGALLSNTAVMQGTVNGCYGYREVFSQRYLLILPLSHVFGLIRNLMTSLYTGSTLFICRSNKDMFRDIAVFRPTALVMVPALAEMALGLSKKFGRNMLGDDLRTIICGAAPVAPYLVGAYGQMGIALLPGYGLTESANLVSGNPESERLPESVGLMFPNQEYRIENGELWLKGLNMFEGYVGEDESEAWSDGWFRTGDLVRFDDEGFLYITGRTKEIIVLPSGENISPAELEAHFNALDCVQDSQVFEDRGERGESFLALEVVPRMTVLAGKPAEEAAAFVRAQLEAVNRSLPSFQQVSRIVIRDRDFDRTPSMKIVRYKK
ncbi:MAG: acyl--CoA ligase [Oscillospiraceae bacterium]|nr:acyl--CoA ligase [Oscillospiraceae bacterium]